MDWERAEDESKEAYAAFQDYLLGDRSVRQTAKNLAKSEALLYKWSSKYEWQDRARQWDTEIMQKAQAEARRLITRQVLKRLNELQTFQDMAAAAIQSKDLSKASVKSLTEMYHAARNAELELYDRLKVTGEEIKITIEAAQ